MADKIKLTANIKKETFDEFRRIVETAGQKISNTLEILIWQFNQGVKRGDIVLFGMKKKEEDHKK